jgi:site-specific recombinase XerD
MESQLKFHPDLNLKLMDSVREVLRYHHHAYRTEQTYCQRILRYIRFWGRNTHPRNFKAHHVERFLSDLVVRGGASASTQSQALNAIKIRMLQKPMGHGDVKTTERCTHVMDKNISRITGPLEGLDL